MLKVGTQVELDEEMVAEVQSPTEDGQWIKIKYIQAPQNIELIGTEDLCLIDEIISIIQEPY